MSISQQYLNSTPNRSTDFAPFNVLVGMPMRLKGDPRIGELIDSELVDTFQVERDELRLQARQNILKTQQANRK